MATAVQSIFIKETERRGPPSKTYVVYKITVNGAVRSWNVWHRYSDFTALHDDITQHASSDTPAQLPPKHRMSLLSNLGVTSDQAIVEERRMGLETYLRAILSAKESKWRDTFVFRDFLGIPAGKLDPSSSSSTTQFTSSAWLDEHTDLQTLIRDARADINKRDSLSSTSSSVPADTSAAHNANVQAKKKLAVILTRLDALAKGLQDLAMNGMKEGEVQRRADMVARMQDECNSLGKMVAVARQSAARESSNRGLDRFSQPSSSSPDPSRTELFAGAPTPASRPLGRVFGQKQPPQETNQTRPLDDVGLVQLQQVQMDQQDAQLSQLSALLNRQKHLGLAINAEIEQQNELLDMLSADIDRTSGKLASTNKQMKKLK